MSSLDVTLRRQNRANFFSAMSRQQAFNLGIINTVRGANQPTTSSGLLSASDGKIDVTPNQQALTLAKNLGLTDQILFFERLVTNNIPTSKEAVEFAQVALSNPELAIEEFSEPSKPTPPPPPYNALGIAEWAVSLYLPKGSNTLSCINSIITDSANNIYVTGIWLYPFNTFRLKNLDGTDSSIYLPSIDSALYSSTFLIKYNAAGNVEWATYLKYGSNTTTGWSLAVDSQNNIYLVGSYYSSSSITINNGITSGSTYPSSGISLPSSSSTYAVFLIKYDSSGVAKWATYFNGTGGDIGYGITCDLLNNIYITGQYSSSSTVTLYNAATSSNTYSNIVNPKLPIASNLAVFILKYDSDGKFKWANYFNTNGDDIGVSIAADLFNNIYVTGLYRSSASIILTNSAQLNSSTFGNSGVSLQASLSNSFTNNAAFLIKYDLNGACQRATVINSVNNERGNSIAIDSQNNVYLAGTYLGSPTIFNSVGSNGTYSNSFITLGSNTSNSAMLVKYNSSNMNPVWATCFNPSNQSTEGLYVTLDSQDNIYLTGFTRLSTLTALKDVSGNTQKESLIQLPPTTINLVNTSATYLFKYDSAGIAKWANYINGTQTDERGQIVTVDNSNNIYLGGFYSSYINGNLNDVSGNTQISSSVSLSKGAGSFLAKYNPSGITQQVTNITSISDNFNTFNNFIGGSVTTDSLNNVYYCGNFKNSLPSMLLNADGSLSGIVLPLDPINNNIYLIKCDSNGKVIWATYFANFGSTSVNPSIVIDSEDNIYLTGVHNGNKTLYNAITSGVTFPASPITLNGSGNSTTIIKYNSSGVVQWTNYFSGVSQGNDISIDSQNNIYIVAQYSAIASEIPLFKSNTGAGNTSANLSLPISSATGSSAAALVKYNSNGNPVWATCLNGTFNKIGKTVKVDLEDNVYFCGSYNSQNLVDVFDGLSSGSSYVSSGIQLPIMSSLFAVFIIKYNSLGKAQWATYISSTLMNVFKIQTDYANNLYITGIYRTPALGTVSINNSVTSGSTYPASQISLKTSVSGASDLYLIKFNSSGQTQWATVIDATSGTSPRSIAIDTNNNLYLIGNYNNATNPLFLDNAITQGSAYPQSLISLPATISTYIFLAKYNSSGEVQWAVTLGSIGSSNSGNSVWIDSENRVYITGTYSSINPPLVNNVDGNGQIASLITLNEIYLTTGAFLIKYS